MPCSKLYMYYVPANRSQHVLERASPQVKLLFAMHVELHTTWGQTSRALG